MEVEYDDAFGRRSRAPDDAVLAILRALGAAVDGPADAADAIRARRVELWSRVLEPACVAWDGRLEASLRLPARVHGRLACMVQLELGEMRAWQVDLDTLPPMAATELGGVAYVERRLTLPEPLPAGYHRLRVEAASRQGECLVIAAPSRPAGGRRRLLGLFLPLYALHSQRSLGVGDLGDLTRLWDLAHRHGVDLIGSTPLLAAFLDGPFEPSPYSPASRLFFNELYLDLARSPELERCAEARELLHSDAVRAEAAALRAERLVDWSRTYALRRRLLELLARCLFGEAGARHEAFEAYRRSNPRLDDYARFRAADEDGQRYHLYAQWLLQEQLSQLDAHGVALYLDLPLGVHRASYDVHRERESFALGVSGGAPPDPLNAAGQNWDFPPLHPEGIRATAYRYPVACIRTLLRHARALRVDHVMGLHRLFWVPEGRDAADGAYVRYHADELYAILVLEAGRRDALLVGEDLGTVPPEVREAMAARGVRRSYVLQFELRPDEERVVPQPPAASLAGLNTHDTPTFAGFWQGRDLDVAGELGLLDADELGRERQARIRTRRALVAYLRRSGLLPAGEPEPADVARACLLDLARGPAEVVLVNAEDLWGETEPQNVPGTTRERPNWRRKAQPGLEQLAASPAVAATLETLHAARTEAP